MPAQLQSNAKGFAEYVQSVGGPRRAALMYLNGEMPEERQAEFMMRTNPLSLVAFAIAELTKQVGELMKLVQERNRP